MRIVYVADHSSVHTRRWVRFFAAHGHDVHVVTCGGGGVRDMNEDGTVTGPLYPVYDLGRPRFGKVGYLLKLGRARRLIRRLEPDVVHAHYATSNGLIALASGVRPLVTTAHGDDVLIAPRNPLMRVIVRAVLRASALITVPSDHMREAVLDLVGDERARDVSVFQYGVEVQRLARVADAVTAKDPLDRVERPLRIVSTRAMLQLYRLDALIDALGLLVERGVELQCDLVGDGPLRADLEARALDVGLDGFVTFHGQLPPRRVERLVAGADIYVSVAESDGLSLSLLEALALGAIPVLSNIPANRGWVHDGHTGTLVDIDPESIADGILRAALIDPLVAGRDNHSVVAERADMDTNLGACELMMDDLAGVSWDPTPATSEDDAAA